MKKLLITILGLLVAGAAAQAEERVVTIYLTDGAGVGRAIGTVTASSSPLKLRSPFSASDTEMVPSRERHTEAAAR